MQEGRIRQNIPVDNNPPSVRYELPGGAARFTMDQPLGIAVLGAPRCLLVVSDGIDRAFHYFQLGGRYLRSIQYDKTIPGTIASMSLGVDETLIVTTLQYGAKTVFRWAGAEEPLPPIVLDSLPASGDIARSAVAALPPDNRLVEHWFAQNIEIRSDSWRQGTLPLLRVYSPEGVMVGSLGMVDSIPGATLTAALNRGIVAIARDTIWFANTATGKVAGFVAPPLGGHRMPAIAEVVLPIAYQAKPPVEHTAGDGRVVNAVHRHLTAFAIAPSGRFIVTGQVTGYPDSPNELFRPRSMVGVYDRQTERLSGIDLTGEIGAVAATDQWVVVRVLRAGPAGGTSEVVRIPNPLAPRESKPAGCA